MNNKTSLIKISKAHNRHKLLSHLFYVRTLRWRSTPEKLSDFSLKCIWHEFFLRYGWKIYCLKYSISKFEMFWIKAEDFMSDWSWAILSQNGIRIARSKYHVTLSVTSRWCHKHSIQFEHSILLLLLSFLRDRNRLIPRYICLLSRSTSLFSYIWNPSMSTTISCLAPTWRHIRNQLGPVPWPFVTSKWPNFKRS